MFTALLRISGVYFCLSYAFMAYTRTISPSPFQRLEEVIRECLIQERQKTVETETWQESSVPEWTAGSDVRKRSSQDRVVDRIPNEVCKCLEYSVWSAVGIIGPVVIVNNSVLKGRHEICVKLYNRFVQYSVNYTRRQEGNNAKELKQIFLTFQ